MSRKSKRRPRSRSHHYNDHHLQLARAYVPFQMYGEIWDPMEGLKKGTIFPELYDPYTPRERV